MPHILAIHVSVEEESQLFMVSDRVKKNLPVKYRYFTGIPIRYLPPDTENTAVDTVSTGTEIPDLPRYFRYLPFLPVFYR